ncbi:hypothetical protein C5167_020708 [Papaver somniferum]|uniref:DNA helicase Pif1-like 2B domain-containing protein n=1 Tax=Papaver somniferum TaxID=3469 RepID=A0A4Y7ITT3_PAPSO|nr:hypothetical protein C5167_020708 [Papaver somniferum]
MVGPQRPQIVLFGSSIVQFSFINVGWGVILADVYARKEVAMASKITFRLSNIFQLDLSVVDYFLSGDANILFVYMQAPQIRYPGNARLFSKAVSTLTWRLTRIGNINCPTECFNNMNTSVLPPLKLDIKVGCRVLMIRNIVAKTGLHSGIKLRLEWHHCCGKPVDRGSTENYFPNTSLVLLLDKLPTISKLCL